MTIEKLNQYLTENVKVKIEDDFNKFIKKCNEKLDLEEVNLKKEFEFFDVSTEDYVQFLQKVSEFYNENVATEESELPPVEMNVFNEKDQTIRKKRVERAKRLQFDALRKSIINNNICDSCSKKNHLRQTYSFLASYSDPEEALRVNQLFAKNNDEIDPVTNEKYGKLKTDCIVQKFEKLERLIDLLSRDISEDEIMDIYEKYALDMDLLLDLQAGNFQKMLVDLDATVPRGFVEHFDRIADQGLIIGELRNRINDMTNPLYPYIDGKTANALMTAIDKIVGLNNKESEKFKNENGTCLLEENEHIIGAYSTHEQVRYTKLYNMSVEQHKMLNGYAINKQIEYFVERFTNGRPVKAVVFEDKVMKDITDSKDNIVNGQKVKKDEKDAIMDALFNGKKVIFVDKEINRFISTIQLNKDCTSIDFNDKFKFGIHDDIMASLKEENQLRDYSTKVNEMIHKNLNGMIQSLENNNPFYIKWFKSKNADYNRLIDGMKELLNSDLSDREKVSQKLCGLKEISKNYMMEHFNIDNKSKLGNKRQDAVESIYDSLYGIEVKMYLFKETEDKLREKELSTEANKNVRKPVEFDKDDLDNLSGNNINLDTSKMITKDQIQKNSTIKNKD